jgi:hypothetical protein
MFVSSTADRGSSGEKRAAIAACMPGTLAATHVGSRRARWHHGRGGRRRRDVIRRPIREMLDDRGGSIR